MQPIVGTQCINSSFHAEPGVKLNGEVNEMPQAENGISSKEEVPIGEAAGITIESKKATTQAEDKEIEVVPVKEGVEQPSKEQKQERPHKLWLPEKQPHLADLVLALKRAQQQPPKPEAATPLQELESQTKSLLKTRQQMLHERIQATQTVLPQKVYKIKPKEDAEKGNVSKKFVRQKSNLQVSDDVSEYLTKVKAGGITAVASTVGGVSEAISPSIPITEHVLGLRRNYDTQLSSGRSGKCGSIPLNKWREIVRKNKGFFSSIDSEGELEIEDIS